MSNASPYPSLSVLREVHRELVTRRRQGVDDAFLHDVTDFIGRGQATGQLIDVDDDRWDAQNLLDYWSNELFHNERVAPDATLAEYNPGAAPLLSDNQCPYLGLDAFSSSNHAYFFGRNEIVTKMVDVLENGRFLAIVGSSGSGKSSTALAGLLPRLQAGALPYSDKWVYFPSIMPGATPLDNLAHSLPLTEEPLHERIEGFIKDPGCLNRLLNQYAAPGAVLIIDQFEELYTLCHHDHHRRVFIDNLLGVLQTPNNPHTIIITMRSDLESNLMRTAVFQSYFAQYQVRLTPMDAAQLRKTIENPAELVGLKFEEGLIDQLIRDVLGEPSALPLLQFTLLKLWENRDKNRITWSTYRHLGGGRQALANSADTFFNNLPAADRPVVQAVLLRLVLIGQGRDVARDRILRQDLYSIKAAKAHINQLLIKLISARLVRLIQSPTLNEDKVELAHEALLTHWPRLVGWIEESRVTQRRRLQLNAMAWQWATLDQDPSTLLRGLLLEEAQQYDDLDEVETAFVEAGIQERNRAALQRERERKQQLKQAEALADERQLRLEEKERLTQWLGGVSIALAIVFAVAVVAGLLAAQNAVSAEENELTAVASEGTAIANEAIAQTLRETAVANAAQLATAEADARTERDQATLNEQLAILAQETAVSSFLAADNARATAEASAREADLQFRLATARELANAALDQLTSNPQLSLLLAMESAFFPLGAGQDPPVESADILYRALIASQLQRTLSGHTDWVTDVAVSPTGEWIATASYDGTVRIWNAATGQMTHRLEDHIGIVNSVAFNADGSRLASAGNDGFVFIWDTATYELIAALAGENNGTVQKAVFHPDGRRLAAVYEDTSIRIWDTVTRQSILRLFGHTKIVNDVAFNPEGSRFATAGADGSVIVWNAETGAPLYSLDIAQTENIVGVNAVAFHPDGQRIIVAYNDGVSRLWQGQTFLQKLPGHTSAVFDVTFSHNGQLFATAGSEGTVRVWDTATGHVSYIIAGHSGGVTAVQFFPDDSQVLTAGRDNTAKIWRVVPGISPLILAGHSAGILNVGYNKEGNWIVTTGEDRTALIWDAQTGEIVHVFAQHNRPVTDAAFSPDNTILATASEDANVRLWQIESGEVQFLPHAAAVNALAFSPDGTVLASAGSDGFVQLWNVSSRTIELALPHDSPVNAVAYHPDGTLLASGGESGTVYLWSTESGEQQMTFTGHAGPVSAVAFHPDGTRIASAGNDGTVQLWDITGELRRVFSANSGPITDVAFHPNGTLLATTGTDRIVKLWDIASGQNARTYLGHSSTVTAVAFSPNGEHFVTSSIDRTAQINPFWMVQKLFEQAWTQVEAPLNEATCQQYLHGQPCITTNIPGPVPAVISMPTP